MTERRRVLRRDAALDLLQRADEAKTPKSAAAARLMAQFFRRLGAYNEKLGFHKGRYPVEDGDALRWMLRESSRTGETGGQTLAGRYLNRHPKHPGQSYDANIKRLVRLWNRTPKRTQNQK